VKKKLAFVAIMVTGLVVVLFTFNQFYQTENEITYYVATINGIPIPLDQYKVYLRTTVIDLNELGGDDIWHYTVNIDGMPTVEFAKETALELIITVILTNSQGNIQLTEAERSIAGSQAQAVFDRFTPREQEQFTMDTLVAVMEAILLRENTIRYLTQNYHPDEREEVWGHMYAEIRGNAVLERNTEVWDTLDATIFRYITY